HPANRRAGANRQRSRLLRIDPSLPGRGMKRGVKLCGILPRALTAVVTVRRLSQSDRDAGASAVVGGAVFVEADAEVVGARGDGGARVVWGGAGQARGC